MKKNLSRIIASLFLIGVFTQCENDLDPSPKLSEVPDDIVVFESQQELLNSLHDFKNSESAMLDFASKRNIETLYSLSIKAQSAIEEVYQKNSSLISKIINDVDMDREVANKLASDFKTQLEHAMLPFNDLMIFKDGVVSLKYNDVLMASVLNRKGLVIIEGTLFKYTNEHIYSIPYTGLNSLELIEKLDSPIVSKFTISDNGRERSNLRDDIMANNSCSRGNPGNPYEYYIANVKVVNTYTPVYRTVQEWVPEECIEKPNGALMCFPGYWETVQILDHYNLTNTRVNLDVNARKEFYLLFCFDTGGYSSYRQITITGSLNATVSETASRTTRYWDLSFPLAHGSLSTTVNIPNIGPACSIPSSW